MSSERKLWIAFILITTVSLAVLGYFGHEIYQKAPPLPTKVVTTEGDVVFEGQDSLNYSSSSIPISAMAIAECA